MRNLRNPPPLIDRLARVAFTFIVLNWSAVAGLGAVISRRDVWRQ